MATWLNDDGLFIKFGVTEGVPTKGGGMHEGVFHVSEVELSYDDFAAFGTEKIMADNVIIPNGARIEKADVYVETAFAGATATLSLGLIDQDRSTAIDADGIDVTIAVAALTAGATIACDGALIDTTLTNAGLVTATVGTANFTAGKAVLRIYYYIPHADQ